jgi:hypothetical protein
MKIQLFVITVAHNRKAPWLQSLRLQYKQSYISLHLGLENPKEQWCELTITIIAPPIFPALPYCHVNTYLDS